MTAKLCALVVVLMIWAGITTGSARVTHAASSNVDLSHRYVVFVDGIGISSSASTTPCSSLPANPDSNTNICLNNDFADIRATLLSSSPSLSPSHVVYFSYGALDTQYFCQAWGPAACSGTGNGNPGSENLSNLPLSPAYSPSQTKIAPSLQSAVLEWLLGQIIKRDPSASIDIIGYSLGGIVASYWAVTFAPYPVGDIPVLKTYVHSLTVIESPVGGVPLAHPMLSGCGIDPRCLFAKELLDNGIPGKFAGFGDAVLSELQVPESGVSGSIIASLPDAAKQGFPYISIQSSTDYVVNGTDIPVYSVLPALSQNVPVGIGSQYWVSSPQTFHSFTPQGTSLAAGPTEDVVAGGLIFTNHGAPLHPPKPGQPWPTGNWVNQAVGAPTTGGWSLSFAATQTSVPVGTTVTLTATANKPLNGNTTIQILDRTHNNAQVPSSCTATTCTATVNLDSPDTITYVAEIMTADGTVKGQSSPVTVTWLAPPTVSAILPNSGTTIGGTGVSITGTNFTGATSVKFGSTPAVSPHVDSDTQISAVSPTGSVGTVDVTVTTPGGTSATSSNDQFTYQVVGPTTVTNTNDSGPGSLRAAIARANTDGSGDSVSFSIPLSDPGCNSLKTQSGATSVCTISPLSPLPSLTADTTVIDGYTQSGARANSGATAAGDNAEVTINIDGMLCSSSSGCNGITLQGSSDVIRGLSVTNFSGVGIRLGGQDSTVQGNFLGVEPDGKTAGANGSGVSTSTSAGLIGGVTAADRNVISGNTSSGVAVSSTALGIDIEGNLIGTTAAGNAALRNATGVFLYQASCYSCSGPTVTVGGSSAASRNVISGNGEGIGSLYSTKVLIEGNYIGTDVAGTSAVPNENYGLNKLGDTGDVIRNNLISGNAVDGVTLQGTDTHSGSSWAGNTLDNNTIGLDALGQPLPNGRHGVVAGYSDFGDVISDNTIADNTGAGVYVLSGQCGAYCVDGHVAIRQNSTYGNGGLGIDLQGEEDPSTCTQGSQSTSSPLANDYTPCPVIATAMGGQVSGTGCAGCSIDVFVATNEADDRGHGEGHTYIGTATADASGNWMLSGSPLNSGQYVTATATAPASDQRPEQTSEFGANVTVN